MLGNSPSCLEGIFSELPLYGVLGSSPVRETRGVTHKKRAGA
jgi:hypothetical protein